MYNTGIFLIVFGLLLVVFNGYLMLGNYKKHLIENERNTITYIINGLTLLSAFSLTIVGIAYIFIVHAQL
ncbi:hypothetical protein C6P52_12450 [Enterococcus mundtii]|nr:hypothetical protein C6P52_12450 [Enterococcus mundtii]PTO39622.1 hypothetical protein C6P54_14730 [Enterococcus mundtii]